MSNNRDRGSNHSNGSNNSDRNSNESRNIIQDTLVPAIRRVLRHTRIGGGQQATSQSHNNPQSSGVQSTDSHQSAPFTIPPAPIARQEDVPMASLLSRILCISDVHHQQQDSDPIPPPGLTLSHTAFVTGCSRSISREPKPSSTHVVSPNIQFPTFFFYRL